jgi:hypothetical protein
MAPLPDSLLALIPRSLLAGVHDAPTINADTRSLSPMDVQSLHLAKRDASPMNHGAGARPATDFNNKGFQALFAIIAMAMVLAALWFFFWAKNGGFKWKQDDWEDYKSTVLRRKGPDGKTLSNATKSTRLGGGSVVHGGSYGNESSVGYTDETGTSADPSEMREVEEGRGRAFGLRGGDASRKKKTREGKNDYKDADLRDYRGEKAARVGGLNREADGVYTDYSVTQPSELGSNVSSKPLLASKEPQDKKQEAKDKERRARERMRQAKLIEKNAAKVAALEAKAQKVAEKEKAKNDKIEQQKVKKAKKAKSVVAPSEAPPMTEVTAPSEYAPVPTDSPRRSAPSAAYSFVTGDDTATVYSGAYTEAYTAAPTEYTKAPTEYTKAPTESPKARTERTAARTERSNTRTAPSEANESSYYSDYRPKAEAAAASAASRARREQRQSQSQSRSQAQSRSRPAESRRSESRSRHSSASPRKNQSSRPPASAPSDIFTAANGNTQGTISYPCHIPGLSTAGSVSPFDSVSQVGAPKPRAGRDVMAGYRRGGDRGRRDSLSDSDS